MNLMNVKKVLALAAVAVTTVVCLIPEAAQAQRIRFSGNSDNGNDAEFFIETAFPNTGTSSEGLYLGAVDTFSLVTPSEPDEDNRPDENDLVLFSAETGNIRTVSIQNSNLNQFGVQNINEIPSGLDTVVYEITFDGGYNAALFVPTSASDDNLVTSLSGLLDLIGPNTVPGIINRLSATGGVVESDVFGLINPERSAPLSVELVQDIPEPTATSGLLGIGALGAATLVTHKKRLRKQLVSLNKSQNI